MELNLFAVLFPTFKSSLVREDMTADGIFLVLVSSHFHCSNPFHTAQGAICVLLLFEGVQKKGMEIRQQAVALVLIQSKCGQTNALLLFKTIDLKIS